MKENQDYSSAAFEKKNTYYGDDLGVVWSAEHTSFRVWAPTAEAVYVNLFQSGTDGADDCLRRIAMKADANGTWTAMAAGNLNGVYYT
ncbi:MAG: type I pullulanase, partial [Clostridiales bacterium]|nr:type I pullulanase [Clostridiales bacterium]